MHEKRSCVATCLSLCLLYSYFSPMFNREDISSLRVPDAQFQEVKSVYLGQLIVTPEKVTKKIKVTKSRTGVGLTFGHM